MLTKPEIVEGGLNEYQGHPSDSETRHFFCKKTQKKRQAPLPMMPTLCSKMHSKPRHAKIIASIIGD